MKKNSRVLGGVEVRGSQCDRRGTCCVVCSVRQQEEEKTVAEEEEGEMSSTLICSDMFFKKSKSITDYKSLKSSLLNIKMGE